MRDERDIPTKRYTIKIACGWCQKDMGSKPSDHFEDNGKTSHSICPACNKEVRDADDAAMKIERHHLRTTLEKATRKLSRAAAGRTGPGWRTVWEVIGQMELVLKLELEKERNNATD